MIAIEFAYGVVVYCDFRFFSTRQFSVIIVEDTRTVL